MTPTLIRKSTLSDQAAIAKLLPDLGYVATPEDIARRLQVLATRAENEIVLAVRGDGVGGEVVGMCHIQGVPLLVSDGYAEVQALVVAASSQRAGVGSQLLGYAKAWAAQQGYSRVRLRSGLHRGEAHLFYESQGFSRAKASYAFEIAVVAVPRDSNGSA